jgi:glycosyltransferase involved in cell wall biosynthesis
MENRFLLVDGKALTCPMSGIGRYTSNMINSLVDKVPNISVAVPGKIHASYHISPRVHLLTSTNPLNKIPGYWNSINLQGIVAKNKPIFFWGPAHRIPLLPKQTFSIVTVHDVVWMNFPQTMRLRGYLGEQLSMRAALTTADMVLTVSETTKSEIVRLGFSDREKIQVIPNAAGIRPISDVSLSAKQHLANKYFLTVGTFEPRKNYTTLIEAFSVFVSKFGRNYCLILAGNQGWNSGALNKKIDEYGLSDLVKIEVNPSDLRLVELYSKCFAYISPTIYEGFDIPVVEAMEFGRPLILSDIAIHREVADTSAIFFDPSDPKDLAQQLLTVVSNNYKYFDACDASYKKSKQFSWSASADSMAALLNGKSDKL